MTLNPDTVDAVCRLAVLMRQPVATVLRLFIEEALPTMRELIVMMENAEDRVVVKEHYAGVVAELQRKVSELPEDITGA